jgi:aspartyl-tRNA(Asn)/glutamyl-tRNA(Gln) amidotransferase subunit B
MLDETLRNKYEMVIGLEVHCQMKTRTKLFCSCPNQFGDDPNTNVCPVCLGLPGALPVISREAVNLAIRAALATNCTVNETSVFSRKNYFYPDLPKGYQISQYDRPYATDGWVEALQADGTTKTVRLERIHMEDDAGKLLHEGFPWSKDMSGVDLNRSGSPLIEIVSRPDIRSSQEAYAYLTALKASSSTPTSPTATWRKARCAATPTSRCALRGAEKLSAPAPRSRTSTPSATSPAPSSTSTSGRWASSRRDTRSSRRPASTAPTRTRRRRCARRKTPTTIATSPSPTSRPS